MWRRCTAIVAILAGLITRSAVLELQLKEPGYGGRKLSTWLKDMDLENSHTSRQAVYAIQAIGTNAFLMRPDLTASGLAIPETSFNPNTSSFSYCRDLTLPIF